MICLFFQTGTNGLNTGLALAAFPCFPASTWKRVMDQCPPSTPPLNCRPTTSGRAVIVRPTLKNLCRSCVVWIWISVDILITFLQTRHQLLVTCNHAELGSSSAGSLWIVAMKMERVMIFDSCSILLFHLFSLYFILSPCLLIFFSPAPIPLSIFPSSSFHLSPLLSSLCCR